MSEKEMMNILKNEINKLSDAEKESRAKALKKLLDQELNQRKMQALKKPKK